MNLFPMCTLTAFTTGISIGAHLRINCTSKCHLVTQIPKEMIAELPGDHNSNGSPSETKAAICPVIDTFWIVILAWQTAAPML